MSKRKEEKTEKEKNKKASETTEVKTEASGTDKAPEEEENDETAAAEERKPTAEDMLADLKDKYLRLQADFDNYRKRTAAEKIEMIKTASEGVISSLLPVIDDMERALAAFKKALPLSEAEPVAEGVVCEPLPYAVGGGAAQKALSDGVELIYNKLLGVLKQKGVSECIVMNQPFNEEVAEAVAQIPAPGEDQKGVVLDVVQKGYRFDGGKVIRFAKVVVGC